MTPSQQAKAAGLKNLLQVQNLTGVSAQTLTNWCRDKPELFRVVLIGCVSLVGIGKIEDFVAEKCQNRSKCAKIIAK